MSGEIDFSLFIAALRRRWWIILLCVGLALALAAGIGLLQGRRYQASNVLLVQSPRYQWRLSGEIAATTNQNRDYQREVLAIARSDEIAQAAAVSLATGDPSQDAAQQSVQDAIAVRAGDGNTIVVTATSTDPERAAAYASAWTQALIDSAREIYGATEELAAFEGELLQLEARLLEKEAALAAVRARTGLLSNVNVPDEAMEPSLHLQQANQLTELLAGYNLAVEQVHFLRSQVAAAAPGADLAQLPWELLAAPPLAGHTTLSPEVARASLEDPARLAALLQREENALQTVADLLSSQAEAQRTALAADWQEFSNVNRELNQARDLYQIVLRKVNELRLQDRLAPSLLTPVGGIEPLVTHVRAPLWGLLATAAVAGLIVGVLLAVLAERSSRKATA